MVRSPDIDVFFILSHLILVNIVNRSRLPVDKLLIEKTVEAPVWCLHTLTWLSSGVQSICDAEKMYGRHC